MLPWRSDTTADDTELRRLQHLRALGGKRRSNEAAIVQHKMDSSIELKQLIIQSYHVFGPYGVDFDTPMPWSIPQRKRLLP